MISSLLWAVNVWSARPALGSVLQGGVCVFQVQPLEELVRLAGALSLQDTNAKSQQSPEVAFIGSHAGFGVAATELCKSVSFVSIKTLLMDSG